MKSLEENLADMAKILKFIRDGKTVPFTELLKYARENNLHLGKSNTIRDSLMTFLIMLRALEILVIKSENDEDMQITWRQASDPKDEKDEMATTPSRKLAAFVREKGQATLDEMISRAEEQKYWPNPSDAVNKVPRLVLIFWHFGLVKRILNKPLTYKWIADSDQ